MTIRPVKSIEVDTLRAISLETFTDTFKGTTSEANFTHYVDEAYKKETLSQELQDPACHFFFIENDGVIVGYCKLNEEKAQSESDFPNSLEIERIYIRPDHKRQGYGSQLIEFAESFARQKELGSLWLGVWEHNKKAQAFYQAKGFHRISEHSFWMGDDEQTDWILSKSLS